MTTGEDMKVCHQDSRKTTNENRRTQFVMRISEETTDAADYKERREGPSVMGTLVGDFRLLFFLSGSLL